MQLETCFITRSLAARGAASVCADVQAPRAAHGASSLQSKRRLQTERRYLYSCPASASQDLGPPEAQKDLVHLSLSPATAHHLALHCSQVLAAR